VKLGNQASRQQGAQPYDPAPNLAPRNFKALQLPTVTQQPSLLNAHSCANMEGSSNSEAPKPSAASKSTGGENSSRNRGEKRKRGAGKNSFQHGSRKHKEGDMGRGEYLYVLGSVLRARI
jgi:hypothetical protein